MRLVTYETILKIKYSLKYLISHIYKITNAKDMEDECFEVFQKYNTQ